MPDNEYGRKIPRDTAESIIDKRTTITDALFALQEEFFNSLSAGAVKNYCLNKHNSFIFHKDLILRFFTPDKGADYLMVILGAHHTQDGVFLPGHPTVVTAGCKLISTKEDGTKEFVTVDDTDPANEHPPGSTRVDLPLDPIGGREKIFFSFK